MVTLVVTTGSGSLDLYVQKLAEKLDVSKLFTDIYQGNAELFNVSFFNRRALKAVWQDRYFIRMMNQIDGIVHLPNHHLGRYGLSLNRPYIITVHDLIRYLELRQQSTFIHRPNFRDHVYLSLDYKGIKKAAHIIAVSHATKRDLIHHLAIAEERISVVYEGIDHQVFRPVERRLVDYPYLLYVGTEQPRKNLVGLLRAFRILKSQNGFKDLKLVKVGRSGGLDEEFRKETNRAIRELGLSNDVIFTDYVPEEDLPAYYSGTECFVLPSLYEGFGFTPLEAMACGSPVIVSNAASLPEIVGDGALLVDPNDTSSLADYLQVVLTDKGLRRQLVSKGLERANLFSWENTARETLNVYESVTQSLSLDYAPTEPMQSTIRVM
jgi:glycosyltransferase involved in cell wall biosynthesis